MLVLQSSQLEKGTDGTQVKEERWRGGEARTHAQTSP